MLAEDTKPNRIERSKRFISKLIDKFQNDRVAFVIFAGNAYFENSLLVQWIEGGFDYWCSIQYKDGSFDEAYPFERSLAATAFTSFYLSEAYNFLNGRLSDPCRYRYKKALAAAAQWLCHNDEKHGFLSNHLAAAAAALYHAYRICEDERFEERSNYYLDKF